MDVHGKIKIDIYIEDLTDKAKNALAKSLNREVSELEVDFDKEPLGRIEVADIKLSG